MTEVEEGDLPAETADAWGPAFAALTEKQKRFVLCLLELPDESGVLTKAAIRAGYGTATSSKHSMEQIASRLWRSRSIQDAYYECGRLHLGKLGLRALKGAEKILDAGVEHKDFYKTVRMALGYCWPMETTQNINVRHEHKLSQEEGDELARRLAIEAGKPENFFLGGKPLIEGEAVRLFDEKQHFTAIAKETDDNGIE
jgi:hypothetical protein